MPDVAHATPPAACRVPDLPARTLPVSGTWPVFSSSPARKCATLSSFLHISPCFIKRHVNASDSAEGPVFPDYKAKLS